MRTIKLYAHGVGRYEDSTPFVIADENLQIKIENLQVVNANVYAVIKLNGKESPIKVENEEITLPYFTLEAGTLNINIVVYIKGEKVKEYVCEPLILKSVDIGLSAEPEIASIKAELSKVLFQLKEVDEAYAQTIKSNNLMKETIIKLETSLKHRIITVREELTEDLNKIITKIELLEAGYDVLQV